LPFEQRFEENRPFLPKELIYSAKALFYSRRIGGAPTNEPVTELNEEITDYPGTVDLLNAVKYLDVPRKA
jgi:hypothetical protein